MVIRLLLSELDLEMTTRLFRVRIKVLKRDHGLFNVTENTIVRESHLDSLGRHTPRKRRSSIEDETGLVRLRSTVTVTVAIQGVELNNLERALGHHRSSFDNLLLMRT
jgi:hypothetical protein